MNLYGLCIGLGIVSSIWIAEKNSRDLDKKMIFTVLLFGVIGARIYHVVTDYWMYKDASFFELLAIWNGGVGIIGGILGGIAGLIVYLSITRSFSWSELLKWFDVAAMSIPLGQAVGRWGNFFNSEVYGYPTNLPWKIFIPKENRFLQYQSEEYYHPLFLYESVSLLVIWFFLQQLHKKKGWSIGKGRVFGMYLVGYSVVRFFLEFIRISPNHQFRSGLIYSSGISLAQAFCIFGMIIGILFVLRMSSAYKEQTP